MRICVAICRRNDVELTPFMSSSIRCLSVPPKLFQASVESLENHHTQSHTSLTTICCSRAATAEWVLADLNVAEATGAFGQVRLHCAPRVQRLVKL